MEEAFGRPIEYEQVSWDEFEQAAGDEMTEMYRWLDTAARS